MSADRNSAAFERFDPVAGSWERLPDLPSPRGGLGAAFVDGWIVAVGGEEPTRVLDTAEAYDLGTGAWRGLAPLPTPRHGMAVATLGASVVAVNGARRPGHAESAATVEALDFS
jgi:non-specific serine/threonine protein kinase